MISRTDLCAGTAPAVVAGSSGAVLAPQRGCYSACPSVLTGTEFESSEALLFPQWASRGTNNSFLFPTEEWPLVTQGHLGVEMSVMEV